MAPPPKEYNYIHTQKNCVKCEVEFCLVCTYWYLSYYNRCDLKCTEVLLQPCACTTLSRDKKELFSCSRKCYDSVEKFLVRPFANFKPNILHTIINLKNNIGLENWEHSFTKKEIKGFRAARTK